MTSDQLKTIMPHLAGQLVDEYAPALSKAMLWGYIDTPKRQAAFLAQIAHESGELRWMEELASGASYEGRADLGNVRPGDGRRYKGRGPIQLTGRNNYRRCGNALGLDLEGNPGLMMDPSISFKASVWYWTGHGCNELADAGDFIEITKRINGGLNGLAQREAYHAIAKRVFGVVE